jgi:hypothetical protein
LVVDWGGKVAAWFAGVAAASATLAALIAATAKQPFHGWMRVLFITLVIIAGVSFIVLLLTGLRAAWAAWRNWKASGRGPARRAQSGDAVDDTINPAEPRSPDLQHLRGLALEGRVMRARLPEPHRRGLVLLPVDLMRRFEVWKDEVAKTLQPWPECLAQFRGAPAYGLILLESGRKCAEIEDRTKVFEEIVRGLEERPELSGGDVTSTISGGTQYGPVVQGRDFPDLTFSAGPAAPTPDPGKDGTRSDR